MKSYIIDETSQSIREKEPFSDDLLKIKSPRDWVDFLDIILSPSQLYDFHGTKVTFQISDKKISKAIERFGNAN